MILGVGRVMPLNGVGAVFSTIVPSSTRATMSSPL
jgi:hypothetical protein